MREKLGWSSIALLVLIGAVTTAMQTPPTDTGTCTETTNCDDPVCAGNPICSDPNPCLTTNLTTNLTGAEGFEDLLANATTLAPAPAPAPRCTPWATDSDGKNPRTAGCLTYWKENTCANAVQWRWDTCNGNNLTEQYTVAANRMDCAQPTSLTRPCWVWLDWVGNNNGIADECPNNALAICVTQPVQCPNGGPMVQAGLCVCPPAAPAGNPAPAAPSPTPGKR